ncbi:hypothetical protein AB0F93_00190 [Micromonospora tulbaghiae]|uniref:hypothetical protein n=1 Tax=Micromonospora tulbaghiae TaxID=479978 RepID=UPI00331C19B2
MDLRPGDIGFGPIGGLVGFGVGCGQVLLGDDSRYRHVLVVTSAGEAGSEGGRTWSTPPMGVEAMPSGARKVPLLDRWDSGWVYVRLEDYPEEVRHQVALHALAMVDTPYGFSDYAALTGKRFGIESKLLNNWISREDERGYPKRAICSQLADAALTRAGIQVFNDGRLSQDVIPGALFHQMLRLGGRLLWPV